MDVKALHKCPLEWQKIQACALLDARHVFAPALHTARVHQTLIEGVSSVSTFYLEEEKAVT